MTFNIHQLDNMSYEGDRASEDALADYEDGILEQFHNSPEGQARLKDDPDMGFWAEQLINYGWTYLGATLPRMEARHVEEVVTELFPRKVSTLAPEDADDTIPELLAFWEFLKREYQLANAESILSLLRDIAPRFNAIINDPSKFGMAKSFVMAGKAAGYDMTSQEEMNEFMLRYNASLANQDLANLTSGAMPSLLPDLGVGPPGGPDISHGKKADPKKKKLRKLAKAARKANKKKRK